MPKILYDRDGHRCLMFSESGDGEGVQANQFLVVDGDDGAIIDPGGNLAYGELYLGLTQHFSPHKLSKILASHADPDIIASLDRWMTATSAQVYISKLWERFAPHFCKPGKTVGRIIGVPDAGMRIALGRSELVALPAHFLHAEGNFHFWDPTSRILFSGDLGVTLGVDPSRAFSSLKEALPAMEAFHRRYMVSNKALRLWADMVEPLPIDMLVPQHGAPLKGAVVREFIGWARELRCGIDLMDARHYAIPA